MLGMKYGSVPFIGLPLYTNFYYTENSINGLFETGITIVQGPSIITILVSGHLLLVDKKSIMIFVTVPVLQVELLLPVLLEITISVNQPQNSHLDISGTLTTHSGKVIVMKVATIVPTMEDHGLM